MRKEERGSPVAESGQYLYLIISGMTDEGVWWTINRDPEQMLDMEQVIAK
jgi:hypothetical protein